jgi:hypothetical protein
MKIKKLQEGGMAPQGGAPAGGAPTGGPGPEEQIMQMAQQIVQQLGPEAAAMLAQAIMAMLQQGGGGGEEQAPVYARKGGKLTLVNKR